MTVRHFTTDDAKWHQYLDREIFVGDVLDSSSSETMSVGYYRNRHKGDRNEWVVTYDEALIVIKGALTITYAEGSKTARAGEILFIERGTALAYEAGEDDTEVVYVSYPHWLESQQRSKYANLLDAYRPVPRDLGVEPVHRGRPSASSLHPRIRQDRAGVEPEWRLRGVLPAPHTRAVRSERHGTEEQPHMR